MPPALKDEFSPAFVRSLGEAVAGVAPAFVVEDFVTTTLAGWEALELKDRMRRVASCLLNTLGTTPPSTFAILLQIHSTFKGLPHLVFPETVAQCGGPHWDASMQALAAFTSGCSSEFAMREFLLQDAPRGLAQLKEWSRAEDEHLRRLASEACRPRLPWAAPLRMFQNDPSPLLPLLESLLEDPSAYVRRSVANNLNDISKDHPDAVLDLTQAWLHRRPKTDQLLKHACRSLLKAATPRALTLFGYRDPATIELDDFRVQRDPVTPDHPLAISFSLHLPNRPARLRIEALVFYRKANGSLAPKVFQIADRSFEAARPAFTFTKSFQDLSTRKHYVGEHEIAVRINGIVFYRAVFEFER